VLEVGSLQDLWLPNPAGWLSAVANLLNNALATSTWKWYASNLRWFKVYCLVNDISFPPEQDEAIGAIASFLESATQSSQQPSSRIASLSATICTLYKTSTQPVIMLSDHHVHTTRETFKGGKNYSKGQQRSRNPSNSESNSRSTGKSNMTCYYCGHKGHIKSECRQSSVQ